MRNVWIIAGREFRMYFASPVAYTVAAVVLLILGGIFSINIYMGLVNGQISPDGRMVVAPLVTILIFATPALTMRVLADEHRQGTIELLLTAPVRDWELIVGKWLGAFLFMLSLLALTLLFPLVLSFLVKPGLDKGVVLTGYLGLILMVASLVAIGIFISSLFNNQVVVFFISLAAVLLLWFFLRPLGTDTSGGGSQIVTYLNFINHFMNFYKGTKPE